MSEVTVIPDGAVLIVDGVIEQVGPSRRVERLTMSHDAEVIDVTGHVLMPGFVDCFARLLCGPLRDYDESAEPHLAAQKAVRSYSAQRFELEGRKRLRQFVRNGTTTLEASCGYGMDDGTELKALRVLRSLDDRPLGLEPAYYVSGCPPEYAGRDAEYLAFVAAEVLPLVSSRNLARAVVVADEFAPEPLQAFLEEVTGKGFQLHLQGNSNLGWAPRALSVRGLSPEVDIDMAAQARVAVLTPGVNFRYSKGDYPPGRKLIDAGAAVALATAFDNVDCPTCSLPMILSLACTQMGMSAAEALTAATINAAAAIGLQDEVGTIEAGKRADLLIMGCGDYRDIPYSFGMNLVTTVIRSGQQIYPMVEMT